MNKERKDESFINCSDYVKPKKVTPGHGRPIFSTGKLHVNCSVDGNGEIVMTVDNFKR